MNYQEEKRSICSKKRKSANKSDKSVTQHVLSLSVYHSAKLDPGFKAEFIELAADVFNQVGIVRG